MRNNRNVLVSGAGFAGLATTFWMKKLGYNVTLVEIAKGLKKGGTPVNIRGQTVDIVKRMGIFYQIHSNRLKMELVEFKNADDVTERSTNVSDRAEGESPEEFEVERDQLLALLFERVKDDVEVVFDDSITALADDGNAVRVSFSKGGERCFDLVFGCDGIHSSVRRMAFGAEGQFSHFLEAYGSTTIVHRLLIEENTTQMYNEPGRAVMLNAYNGKTDIVMMFATEHRVAYDYRDEAQKREIIRNAFSSVGWRAPELLAEMDNSGTFYFDELSQIKMPSWTKGRVALVGDAGYCASPAAGMGGSLAIDGADALARAFEKWGDDFERAFGEYNRDLRPFVEEVQAAAESFGVSFLVPRTEEAIRQRNAQDS